MVGDVQRHSRPPTVVGLRPCFLSKGVLRECFVPSGIAPLAGPSHSAHFVKTAVIWAPTLNWAAVGSWDPPVPGMGKCMWWGSLCCNGDPWGCAASEYCWRVGTEGGVLSVL